MLAGLNVLLAEDNPTNQLVATQMLESLGARVSLARDGVEALEIVEAEPFDLLLIDIEMPRLNGIELMRKLRASGGPLAALPMIALTAYVMREHVAAISAAGADGVIAKPILSIEQFGKHIRDCMRRRGGANEAAARGRDHPAAAGAQAEPAQAAEPAGAATIDREVYDSLMATIGEAAMADLLRKIEADLRSAAGRLERAVAGEDVAEVRAVSHILISVAGAIGAAEAQELARRVNRAAHAGGDAGAIWSMTAALLAETARVIAFVQSGTAAADA